MSNDSFSTILSIGIVPFDFDENPTIEELRERSLFYKFDSKDQIINYGTTTDKEVIEWWKKQSPENLKNSFYPNPEVDVKIKDVWHDMVKWVDDRTEIFKSRMFWQRGCFEQHILQGVNKLIGNTTEERIDHGYFAQWSDVRTALRLMYGSDYDSIRSKYYGKIIVDYPGWYDGVGDQFEKHNPIDDCIIDICLLLYGRAPDHEE